MKRANFPHRRDQRRAAAAERQAAWDKLSPDEKIEKIKKRCGDGSKAEQAKIAKKASSKETA